jgi:hypothetical protein
MLVVSSQRECRCLCDQVDGKPEVDATHFQFLVATQITLVAVLSRIKVAK